MRTLTLVRERLHRQRLTGPPFADPVEAVARLGAVQGQEYAEALWSLGMRLDPAWDEAAVAAACDRGELLRTHLLRPTWHLVTPGDIRWLLRLTGPRVQAQNAGRYRALELDADTRARGAEALAATLADGEPRTRPELGDALAAAGLDAMAGQRLAYAVMHAELEGVVASGPRRGRRHTYLSLEGRVPPAPERERAGDLAELARRYFDAHGPATLADWAAWSGLTQADGAAGIAAAGPALEAATDAAGTTWHAAAGREAPPARSGALLIPSFDETVVVYRSPRVALVGRAGRPLGSGELVRPVVIDGRTVGSWRRLLSARTVTVEVALLTPLSAARARALDRAVARFGAFLGRRVELVTAVSSHQRY